MAFASYAHTRALTIDDGTDAGKGRVNDTDVAGHCLPTPLASVDCKKGQRSVPPPTVRLASYTGHGRQ